MRETYILGAPSGEDSITAISYHHKRPDVVKDVELSSKPLTYEEAISATGFGKFNIMLLLVSILSVMASIFATSSMSYILSEAQCDLSLSLDDKGMLNAITYIGMICSAFLWGMIGDTYGRRIVLLYSYSFDGIICILATFSRTKYALITAKYFSGFMMNGPISVLMCYLSEFHATSFRPKLITIVGVNYSIARTTLPLLAWGILPLKLDWPIWEGYIEYKSWQVFLLIGCVPSLIAGFAHYLLPETPKFLMTKGRFDEAIEVLKKVYVMNTGHAPESLPFSELEDETFVAKPIDTNKDRPKSKLASVLSVFNTFKPLFMKPFLCNTFLMASIMFGGLLGGNTLRLWLPQLFTTMDEYIQTHNESASICEMLDYSEKDVNISRSTVPEDCSVPEVSEEVYINNVIVPVCSIVGYFIVAALVKPLGKKTLLVSQYLLSGVLVISNYWATNTITTVALSSLFLTFFSICATTATATAVEIYPTNLRTMASSIFLLCGRAGSILGNTLFPFLLYTGCLPPFLFLGGFMFVCAIFSFMLPGTENKPLK